MPPPRDGDLHAPAAASRRDSGVNVGDEESGKRDARRADRHLAIDERSVLDIELERDSSDVVLLHDAASVSLLPRSKDRRSDLAHPEQFAVGGGDVQPDRLRPASRRSCINATSAAVSGCEPCSTSKVPQAARGAR